MYNKKLKKLDWDSECSVLSSAKTSCMTLHKLLNLSVLNVSDCDQGMLSWSSLVRQGCLQHTLCLPQDGRASWDGSL